MARSLFILKAGSKLPTLTAFAGDYEDWIAQAMGVAPGRVEVIPVAEGAPLPPLVRAAAVAITGSAAMITDGEPWMDAGARWLREAAIGAVPTLGICFGHQWLAQALGGAVGYNPAGVEVGTVEIRLTGAARSDPLFAGMPEVFPAQATHRQSVLRPPAGSALLAASGQDGCQAFRFGACAWGAQFHPEFEAAMMDRFIDHFAARLEEEGRSSATLRRAIAPSPDAAKLLARFGRLAGLAP